jgi:thiamine pyrophosphokinase
MGLLYKSVMAHQEMKRNFVIEKLKGQGITHIQNGTSIHELSYDDLKYELVKAAFREIDAESSENDWF